MIFFILELHLAGIASNDAIGTVWIVRRAGATTPCANMEPIPVGAIL